MEKRSLANNFGGTGLEKINEKQIHFLVLFLPLPFFIFYYLLNVFCEQKNKGY